MTPSVYFRRVFYSSALDNNKHQHSPHQTPNRGCCYNSSSFIGTATLRSTALSTKALNHLERAAALVAGRRDDVLAAAAPLAAVGKLALCGRLVDGTSRGGTSERAASSVGGRRSLLAHLTEKQQKRRLQVVGMFSFCGGGLCRCEIDAVRHQRYAFLLPVVNASSRHRN